MSSPFPELPRSDCDYTPTVQAFSGPMMPKPKWSQVGESPSYDNPSYPSGGGPDDVPPAPAPMGQATPATISPPTQTSMGGGSATLDIVQAVADGSEGSVSVKSVTLKAVDANPNFVQAATAQTVKYFHL